MPSLLALLPYLEVPALPLGPLSLEPFGVLVVAGIVVGRAIARRRAVAMGLSQEAFLWLVLWTVLTGLALGHVTDVLAYYPESVLKDPWRVVRLWEGLSSYGGFFGAALAFFLYGRRTGLDLWVAADAIALGLPVGWLFGRLGCAVVHDHPGVRSESVLAVAFPDGGRFDLGLFELALTPLLVVVVFVAARWATRPGTVVAALSLAYPWLRFPLDFLRAPPDQGGDVRYFGFTPGQYASLALLGLGLFLWTNRPSSATAVPSTAEPQPATGSLST